MNLAGLDHKAQLMRLDCVAPDGLVGDNISWRRVDWELLKEEFADRIVWNGGLRWEAVREIVGRLKRAKRRSNMFTWWTEELAAMWDVRQFRNHVRHDDYCLAQKVYRNALSDARNHALQSMYASTGDPDIFRKIDRLDLRRTLPSMLRDDGNYSTRHCDISDMIADQLGPCAVGVGTVAMTLPDFGDLSDSDIVNALASCPKDTSPGFDGITYPFLRCLHRTFPVEFGGLVCSALESDCPDFHVGEVVLIQKAAKSRYDVVKSWRMIALLPPFSKLLERIVLVRPAGCLDLGETQFGCRRKRGVHDAVVCVLEFLKENRGMERLLVSMDVEGGFDKLDRGLLLDFLAARGSPSYLNAWIGRWCEDRVVRFRFNGCISHDYTVLQGVPQGSPLSPFLFGAYVADVMTPWLRYGPAVRMVVVSYVDDTVIAVTANSWTLAM